MHIRTFYSNNGPNFFLCDRYQICLCAYRFIEKSVEKNVKNLIKDILKHIELGCEIWTWSDWDKKIRRSYVFYRKIVANQHRDDLLTVLERYFSTLQLCISRVTSQGTASARKNVKYEKVHYF